MESVKFCPELIIKFPLVSQIFLEIPVDHVFDRANFIQLTFQIVSKTFLITQLVCDVALFMSCLLKLGKDEVKSLHKRLLVLLEHDDLVLVLLMGLVELPIVLQVCPIILNRS